MATTPKTLTIYETELLLESLHAQKTTPLGTLKAIRNHTMALIMLDAGLRVGELVQLKISDLFFGDHPVNNIVVRAAIAKRHHERTIPVSSRLLYALIEMVTFVWAAPNARSYLPAFTRISNDTQLTVRAVQNIIKHASLKSINRKITPHMLRHTFATRLMQKTSIRVVQQLLGHTNLNSTQIYTHPNQEDLANAIKGISVAEAPQTT